jgi:Chalcone isomerase-like
MRMPFILTTLLVTTVLLVGMPMPATASKTAGAVFDREIHAGPHRLVLRGAGVLNYLVFIKAYAAAFYLSETVASKDALTDVPKRLEIEYFHDISAGDFAHATIESIRNNTGAARFERLKPHIAAFNAFYRNVSRGDRYAVTYTPGQGLVLLLNGAPLGAVANEEFAAAFFGIWLGESPLDENLKRRLLGR